MPRFVVLSHDWPDPHFDFMLEEGPTLLTWRLASRPEIGEVIPAERIADHRLAYLHYEGPVRGSRGTVQRIDGGTYERTDEAMYRFRGEWFRGTGRWEEGRGVWSFTDD